MEEFGGIFMKVMTDEQIEVLGKQIAAYSTISEQLEDLHRTLITTNSDDAGGGVGMMMMMKGGTLPATTTGCYSLMGSSNQNKISRRQRWNPTSDQLQILERVFDQEGIRTPNPQKVKEIAVELASHGQISEPNVYNWFQNRRARLKKKRMLETQTNNNISADESGAAPATEEVEMGEDCLGSNTVSQENALTGTMPATAGTACGGVIIPAIISFHEGCRRRPSSRDFAEMGSHGRMSKWEGRRH